MKKIAFIFAMSALALFLANTADYPSAKEKRTDNLHEVTYSVSDCL